MKLAFLFLTTGDLTKPGLWGEFFRGQSTDAYSIYCHAKFPERIDSAILKSHLLPETVETRYGDISLVRAMLLLLKHAFLDPDNRYFLLLSDSCIPLYSFAFIRDAVTARPLSFISCQLDRSPETQKRYAMLKEPGFVPPESFFKQQQWMILRRDAVEVILKRDYTEVFEEMYAPDEHYFVNVLVKQGFLLREQVFNLMTTFVNWRDMESIVTERVDPVRGTYRWRENRPKTYHRLTENDLALARNAGCLFFRKVAADCDCGLVQVSDE